MGSSSAECRGSSINRFILIYFLLYIGGLKKDGRCKNYKWKYELRRFFIESVSSMPFLFVITISYFLYCDIFPITVRSLLACIAIFVLVYIILFFIKIIIVKKSKEILIISETGITDKKLFGFIPWTDIKGIKLYSYGWSKNSVGITLDIINIEEKIEKLPLDMRASSMFSYKKGDPLIKIQEPLTPEIEKIYELLDFYINSK